MCLHFPRSKCLNAHLFWLLAINLLITDCLIIFPFNQLRDGNAPSYPEFVEIDYLIENCAKLSIASGCVCVCVCVCHLND